MLFPPEFFHSDFPQVRDEANAAFAADGVSRLTGIPGVCAGIPFRLFFSFFFIRL